MTSTRPLAVLAMLAAALASGCGPKRLAPGPGPGAQALVVLLQDPGTGITGRVGVSNGSGSADLAAERESTATTANRRPGPVRTMSEAEVQRVFGSALAALPPPARHFTLYFRFESDELTDESRALVPEILSTVKQRSDPEVAVIGHTDTMGTPRTNVELGLKRAATVLDLLVAAGLDQSTVEAISHGEGNLLIQTADETPEPRNRRVEITVR
jgi:outer membrane protein OmpA-like peptidoglycan-associated protein